MLPNGIHLDACDILYHLLVSTAYVAWSLTGVVAFSFMVSSMTDAPFGAIFAGVGLYFASLILDAISSLGSIRYVLPTHYFDTWVDLLTRGEFHANLWRGRSCSCAKSQTARCRPN